jgi:hypothetical protein
MIINRFNIKIFAISTLLLVILNGEGYSQGTDINTSGQQKHFYIGISPGFGISGLKITGASEISNAQAEGKAAFTTTLDLGYSFNKYIGISTGVGFSSVTTAISLESYSAAFDTTDTEGEKYNRRIDGKYIHEEQKFTFIKIPLALNLQIPFTKGFGLYVQAGVNFCLPKEMSYNSEGEFSYSGYYSTYNALISDISYEGFVSDHTNNTSGVLKMNSMYKELFASAGFQINMGKSVSLLIGGAYTKMSAGLNNTSTSAFRLSAYPDKMKSMLAGSTSASLTSFGLKLALRIYL